MVYYISTMTYVPLLCNPKLPLLIFDAFYYHSGKKERKVMADIFPNLFFLGNFHEAHIYRDAVLF